MVNPEIVANLEKGKYLDMPSLINNELEKNHSAVSVFPIHEYWLDIGQIEDYQKLKSILFQISQMSKKSFIALIPARGIKRNREKIFIL